jgi:Ca-activated chloride channel family protein
VNYQLVTDETSMLVLAEDAFERHGIERRNRERVRLERTAQSARAAAPQPVNHRVDKAKPFTPSRSHSFGGSRGGGGGALSPWAVIAVMAFLLAGLTIVRRQGSSTSA